MLRSNFNYHEGDTMDHYSLGVNHLSKLYREIFNILLSPDYYEGSAYGEYFKFLDSDGTNSAYVAQPETERALAEFIEDKNNTIKYLIGYTGVGKTTVLRNFFKVFDRKIVVRDNNLILYHSFFSMSPHSMSVEEAVVSSLRNAINTISNFTDTATRLLSYDDQFYKSFYEFFKGNNEILLNSFPNNQEFIQRMKSCSSKEAIILDYILNKDPLSYTLMELKFHLSINKKKYKNLIIIFDDIETKDLQYNDNLIFLADTIKNCLSANQDKSCKFKILVSLRSSTWRLRNERLQEAHRKITSNQFIIKQEVPKLREVILRRLNVILNHQDLFTLIAPKNSWTYAEKSLRYILSNLYTNYDDTIMALTHNNIFKSMMLLLRIITNRQFFGKYEVYIEKEGAFEFSEETYKRVKNDDIYYALALGEGKYYYDCKDYYLTNILHSHYDQYPHCELLGLYIIRYFLNKFGFVKSLYGLNYLSGKDIIHEITQVYYKYPDKDFVKQLQPKLKYMLKFLYEGGVLLQSIHDKEQDDRTGSDRIYKDRYLLYLSLRGKKLYDLLSENSLLLELYLDDIDTDSSFDGYNREKLFKTEILLKCIEYIKYLFEIEKGYILKASQNMPQYFQLFGNEFIVAHLIYGVIQSIKSLYYQNSVFHEMALKINSLIEEINLYAEKLEKQNPTICFKKISSLE